MDSRCCKCWWYINIPWFAAFRHAASQAWPWDCMCQCSWSKVWLWWLLSELLLIIQVSVGFFPNFWRLRADATSWKWESTTEVLCHHQLDLSDSRSWGCIYTWRRRVGVGPSLRFWDPNLDPLTYHTGMGFASQSTPLVAWHRHHISKASMFMLYNTAMFDPLFLGTFIPQMSKKNNNSVFCNRYKAHFPLG